MEGKMQNTIKAVLYHNPEKIEVFSINVDESNFEIISKKLISEKKKIVIYLDRLKKDGLIKSQFRPKNKNIQNSLNNLVAVKKIINNSLETIKEIYR